MRTHALCLGLVTMALATSGCNSDVVDERYGIVDATLTRAEDCGHLLLLLKRDQLVKMNARIDSEISVLRELEASQGDKSWGAAEESDGDFATGSSSTSSSGTAPPQNGSGGASSGGEPPEHSETNTQVAGVDEADIVKTDGNYLYIVHGGTLAIVQAWPVTDLAVENTIEIEGQPIEMFLANDDAVESDRLVVYSTVGGTDIYAAAGVAPPAPAYTGGSYPESGPDYPGGYSLENPLTKITIMDLDGTEATVALEYYFEGNYRSSRRVGSHVRTVLNAGHRPGPAVKTTVMDDYYDDYYYGGGFDDSSDFGELIAELEGLRFDNTIAISAATLDEYLPNQFLRAGALVENVPRSCSSYFVPTEGSTEYGMSQVQAIDLDALGDGPVQAFVVGDTHTVYSNAESMILAGRVWHNPMMDFQEALPGEMTSGTHLHKFDLTADPAKPRYVGSGTVAGEIHNQFSLDEREGMLRVATTEMSSDGWGTRSNNLFVLETKDGALELAGSVRGLAPGEDIYSVRFVGDKGYIVTFRQMDPLFVFDLADPRAPKLLGELHIPGFSEYMHPINDGKHLLTIGQDGDWSVALQIFDVTDPTSPQLTHKEVLSGASSEAEYDHKAFTFYEGRLAIPLSGYEYGSWISTLALFDIDVVNGITLLGTIDHSPLFGDLGDAGYCYPYGVGVRRGVFIDQYIYSISSGGVLANDIENQLELAASAALPELPTTDCNYY